MQNTHAHREKKRTAMKMAMILPCTVVFCCRGDTLTWTVDKPSYQHQMLNNNFSHHIKEDSRGKSVY